jgi:hypothetical protein
LKYIQKNFNDNDKVSLYSRFLYDVSGLQYKDFVSFTSKERSLSSARNHTPASPVSPSRHSSSSSSRKTRTLLPLIEVLSDGYITSKHIEMGKKEPPIIIMILMTKIRGLMLMKDIKVDIPSDITKLRTFLINCQDSIIELLYVFSVHNNDLLYDKRGVNYGSIKDRKKLYDAIKKLHEEIKADIELFNKVIPSLQKEDLDKNINAFEDSLGKAWHSGSNNNSLVLSKSVISEKLDPSRPQRKYDLADITDIQTQYFKNTTKIAYYVMMIDYISAEINSIYLKTLQNRIKVKTADDIYKEELYGYL